MSVDTSTSSPSSPPPEPSPGEGGPADTGADPAAGEAGVGGTAGEAAAVSTDDAVDAPADEAVLVISERAMDTVLGVRDAEDDPASLALRVSITGASGVDFTYALAFEPLDELEGEHHLYTQRDLSIAVPVGDVDSLVGAVLDLPSNPGQGGLVIRNPNRPNPLAGRHLELTGSVAERVSQLIAEAINPGLASHGGYTSLVGVEGTTVFLTMGGGCQGCSLSAATLVQGIQAAIKDAVPEVTDVVDVTDHAAGENPYFD